MQHGITVQALQFTTQSSYIQSERVPPQRNFLGTTGIFLTTSFYLLKGNFFFCPPAMHPTRSIVNITCIVYIPVVQRKQIVLLQQLLPLRINITFLCFLLDYNVRISFSFCSPTVLRVDLFNIDMYNTLVVIIFLLAPLFQKVTNNPPPQKEKEQRK